MSKFGERLRALRRERDLGQKEIAALCGLSPSSIGKYEKGSRTPPPDVISKLADKFGVTTDYLLGKSDIRTPLLSPPKDSEFGMMVKEYLETALYQTKQSLSLEQEWLLSTYGKAPEAIKEAVRSILKPYEDNTKSPPQKGEL